MDLIKNSYKSNFSIKRYLFILSLVFLLPTARLSADGILFAPLVRASYDFNLGYTMSWGFGIQNCKGECSPGGYLMYSHSKKIQKSGFISQLSQQLQQLHQPREGSSLSFGLYAGMGIASFRFGVNRMLFKEKPDKEKPEKLWGVEASGQMIFVNFVAGAMYNSELKNIKPRLGLGLGIF